MGTGIGMGTGMGTGIGTGIGMGTGIGTGIDRHRCAHSMDGNPLATQPGNHW